MRVGAFLVAGPHRLVGIVHAVDHPFRGAGVAAQLPVDAIGGIGMAAGGGQALAGGEDAGADDVAFSDRAADGLRQGV